MFDSDEGRSSTAGNRAKLRKTRTRAIPYLRWWNWRDSFSLPRLSTTSTGKTLSILAPYLKQDFHWTNVDYANHRDCVSRGVFHRTDGLRALCGSSGNEARSDDQRRVVFQRFFAVDLAGERLPELRAVFGFLLGRGGVPRTGRGRARRSPSGFPKTRARTGDRFSTIAGSSIGGAGGAVFDFCRSIFGGVGAWHS